MAVNAARTKKKNCEVNNFCYFLGRGNFFFFQEESASLSSARNPFSSDLEDWKVKILPLDVNHGHASRSHWV